MSLTRTPFYSALAISAATIAFKSGIIKLIIVRTRVGSEALVWPEDPPALSSLAPFFKPLLLTFIPFYQSDKNIERLNAVERNNSDNEPFLLFAAAAWGYLTGGNPAAYASQLLYAAVASRYVHNIAFITESQPLRVFAYVPALAISLYISTSALLSSIKK